MIALATKRVAFDQTASYNSSRVTRFGSSYMERLSAGAAAPLNQKQSPLDQSNQSPLLAARCPIFLNRAKVRASLELRKWISVGMTLYDKLASQKRIFASCWSQSISYVTR